VSNLADTATSFEGWVFPFSINDTFGVKPLPAFPHTHSINTSSFTANFSEVIDLISTSTL